MRRPNFTAQRLPIDKFFQPRQRRENSAVERLDCVEESFANGGDVAAREVEAVAFLISVSVSHVEPNGQLQQDARALDDSFAKDGLLTGVGRSERVRIVIRPANKPGFVRLVDVAGKVFVEARLPVARAANGKIDSRSLQCRPIDVLVENGNIHSAHKNPSVKKNSALTLSRKFFRVNSVCPFLERLKTF